MPEITKEEYDKALILKEQCEKTLREWTEQRLALFEQRLRSGEPFTDDELTYSAESLCPCGHGLAYPKDAGPGHWWDCSAILKGIAEEDVKHTGQLPFAFYDVKSESEHRGTTRGVFRPQVASKA